MNTIEIENLSRYFGPLPALEEIYLVVKKGEFLTIFGPNGAGKTTLIRILATILRPSEGKIKINGLDLLENSEQLRYQIGVISHTTFLYDNLTARENLSFYGKMYNISNLNLRIDELVTQLGLKNRQDDLVRTFSRGMQQRLSIARALIHNPEILLFDEPYTGLDGYAAKILENLLTQLHTRERTIILTTHNLEQGLKSCQRVAVLVKGKIAYEEEAERIKPEEFEKKYFEIIEKSNNL